MTLSISDVDVSCPNFLKYKHQNHLDDNKVFSKNYNPHQNS
jgi:hypothetical protein